MVTRPPGWSIGPATGPSSAIIADGPPHIANEVVGHIEGATLITRTADADGGDSPLGNLIADAQKADESVVKEGKPIDVAFMNPGGIRAHLVENADGEVTYEDGTTYRVVANNILANDPVTVTATDRIMQVP